MTMKEELIEKIKNRTLTMGVCGLGYVGLPLAVDKAKHGFHTIGFDVQQEKVDMVNAGKNYIGDVVNSDLEELVSSGMLSATTDFSRVCDVDFIAICVPTPLDKHQQPDISYVRDSTIAIAKHLTRGSIVVLESTTYPGTTEELLKPLLEEGSGLKCGTDFYLGFSRAHRSGQSHLQDQQYPQGCGCHRRRRRGGHRHGVPLHPGGRCDHRILSRRGGDGEDPGEYLPQHQHRLGK